MSCLCFSPAYSAVLKTLTSADNFDGINNAAFSIKTSDTEEGTTYILSDDILIQNVAITKPANTSCFKNTKGDLLFNGNNRSLTFNKITTTTEGKMILNSADTFFTMSCFSKLKFLEPTSSKKGKSVISSKGSLMFRSNDEILFTGCYSSDKGGAICCIPNPGSKTTSSLSFYGNRKITFSNNVSVNGGGAIYAKQMYLTAMGPTNFMNNTAAGDVNSRPGGGAIAIAPNGELSLFAEEGDITFTGNTTIRGSHLEKNAIHLENDAFISYIGAREGRHVKFYDAITSTSPSDIPLLINQITDGNIYKGTVLFSSGECVGSCSSLASINMSRISQDMILAGGTLNLSSGAILSIFNFIQRPNTTFILDQSTMLRVKQNAEFLNITVPVKLNHLDPQPQNSKIKFRSLSYREPGQISLLSRDKKLSFSGSINIDIQDEDFYENIELANSTRIPLVKIESAELDDTRIKIDHLHVPTDPYGYQGSWKLEWLEKAPRPINTRSRTNAEKIAHLVWTPKHYRPRLIDSQGNSLVPNSLWNAFVDIRGIHNLMDTISDGSLYRNGLWISEVSNYFHKDHHKDNRGFRHASGGYALGLSQQTPSKDILSIGFFQMFGVSKDASLAKNRENILAGSLYLQHSTSIKPILNWSLGNLFIRPEFLSKISSDLPLILNVQATYSHSKNKLTITRKSSEITHGYWNTHCVGAELGSSLSFDFHEEHNIFHQILPFMNLQGVYAYQRKFKEEGEKKHEITSSKLGNVSLPIGVRLEGHNSRWPIFYSTSLAFIADLFRQNPCSTITSTYAPFATWKTSGTNLSRQALAAQLSMHCAILDNITLFSKCCAEIRKSSQYYSGDIGSQFLF
ncbi:Polymorphic membrane protein F,chlamydial polymorphic outer membrane protein repeat,Autotransporter beta-domain [Chlamydia poikilotherma]|uniref:Polymorphic membrane protein F,chlamydial polymorphic outer membrane protein repeat,Autotransporter beta-domain n=2 Tax=Chlamydia poikilotherma TaxID=1967783 RepID=A0A3B0PV53_9CHLA|nr:Polymorphic membrane protein F,chlamydial polymorphic outer membrane protein repeat,Autotransporter beta-domain [Chlamydia poikilotherma]